MEGISDGSSPVSNASPIETQSVTCAAYSSLSRRLSPSQSITHVGLASISYSIHSILEFVLGWMSLLERTSSARS